MQASHNIAGHLAIIQFLAEVESEQEPSQFDFVLHLFGFFSLAMTNEFHGIPPLFWKEDVSEMKMKYLRYFSNAMNQLVDNEYFRRLWTLQEMVLAPMSLVTFGHLCIPTIVFLGAWDALESRGPVDLVDPELYNSVMSVLSAFGDTRLLSRVGRTNTILIPPSCLKWASTELKGRGPSFCIAWTRERLARPTTNASGLFSVGR